MTRGSSAYVLAVLAACNFLNYAQRNVLVTAYGDLRARFDPSDAAIGLLASVYIAAHALTTLPAGWFGDRVDRRRLLAAAALVWSIGGGLAAIAPDMITLVLARGLTGLATAVVVPVANALIAEALPAGRKASVLAIFNLGLMLGGLGGFVLGEYAGYPGGVFALSAPGFLAAVLIARLDVPGRRRAPKAAPGARELLQQFGELVRIEPLRWVMLSTTFMAFASGGYLTWLKDFLEQEKHLSGGQATQLLGIVILAGLAGIVVGGRVADRLRTRRPHGRLLAIALGMTCSVPCAVVCVLVPAGALMIVAAIVMMFFFSWYHGPMAATIDDLAPEGRGATSQALVIFAMHLFGTAPASWLVGEIKQTFGFTVAMFVPTAAVVFAAIAMACAARSFPARISRAGAR